MPDIRNELQATLGTAYTIERELGGGGMSRVFVAEETALARKVVIKILAPELAAGVSAERFQREIKVAAQLQHPNIVPVLAAGLAGGLPYYVMPFVEGFSLRARLSRNGALPVAEAVALLRDVARALTSAHAHGVVHRDIKPENILLADEAAVVTDFGIAKALHASRTDAPGGTLTQVGTSLGTPAYMAPEQAAGDPDTDHRADIYSFGCVAYETLAGVPPFGHRSPHQLFAAHMNEDAPSLRERRTDAPAGLLDLIARCMEKDPGRRPQSARELLHALDAVPTPVAHMSARTTKRRAAIIVGALAAAAALVTAAVLLTRSASAPQRSGIRALAVLPFENVGGDTANAYFADGMAEELGTALAQLPGVRIASRTSSNRFRGSSVDLKQVGRDLNVDAVVEASVRRAGNQLRITARLTNVSDGLVLWTTSYSRAASDVFAVQDDIAKNITSALKATLAGNARAAPSAATRGTDDLAAYDLYLRGRHLWSRRGPAPLRLAANLFQQAIARDRNFSRAYAGLALVYSVMPQYGERNTDSVVVLAIRAGEQALALDSTLSDAHLGLAYAKIYQWKWEESEAHFKRALELDPNNAPARQWYGDFLYISGRTTEAVEEMKRAFDLDPYSPGIANDYSWALFEAGRFKEAVEMARRTLEIDSTAVFVAGNLALYDLYLLPRDSVVAVGQENLRRRGNDAVTMLLGAYMKAGRPAEGLRLLDSLTHSAAWSQRRPTLKARAFVQAGFADSSIYWLQRAIDERDGTFFLFSVSCGTEFKPLRGDPRFVELFRKIGIRSCPP